MPWIPALVAVIAASPVAIDSAEFFGWSANERYALWRNESRFVVVDAARGAQLTFDSVQAFVAWSEAHPVTTQVTSRGGAGSLRVTSDTGAPLVEAHGVFSCRECAATKAVTVAVARGAVSETVRLGPFAASETLEVTPRWSPGKARVALELLRTGRPPNLLAQLVTLGASVEVLAPAPLDPRVDGLIDAICQAGFAVTSVGAPVKARARSVVFAKDPGTPEARALAALLPEATLEPLTWKANAPFVVALADTTVAALPPVKPPITFGAELRAIETHQGGPLLGWTQDGAAFAFSFQQTRSRERRRYTLLRDGQKVPIADPRTLAPAELERLEVFDPAQELGDPQQLDLEPAERLERAVVIEAATGKRVDYLLSYQTLAYQGAEDLQRAAAKLRPAAEFEAWKKAHPTSLPTTAADRLPRLWSGAGHEVHWAQNRGELDGEEPFDVLWASTPRGEARPIALSGSGGLTVQAVSDPTGRFVALSIDGGSECLGWKGARVACQHFVAVLRNVK